MPLPSGRAGLLCHCLSFLRVGCESDTSVTTESNQDPAPQQGGDSQRFGAPSAKARLAVPDSGLLETLLAILRLSAYPATAACLLRLDLAIRREQGRAHDCHIEDC
jgi:hypothetical protein